VNPRREANADVSTTANGRTPTAVEQTRIDVGVLASRELSDTGLPETEEWVQQLTELDKFFQGWPTDAEAASSTDEDVLKLLEKIDNRRFNLGKRSPRDGTGLSVHMPARAGATLRARTGWAGTRQLVREWADTSNSRWGYAAVCSACVLERDTNQFGRAVSGREGVTWQAYTDGSTRVLIFTVCSLKHWTQRGAGLQSDPIVT
jgi:hypothetical protein